MTISVITKIKYIIYNDQDYAFFIITLFARLYIRIVILRICGKHLNDRIISLRGDVWANKSSLIPPYFIEVPVQYQDSERSCHVCVRGIDFASFYDFDIWFWNRADNVVFFVFHFINQPILQIDIQYIYIYIYILICESLLFLYYLLYSILYMKSLFLVFT
jgi:hypothetical protein